MATSDVTFTLPSTVHRMDHTGRGVQQGGQHGCEAVAVAIAERMKAADPKRTPWWVATRNEDYTLTIRYI